MKERFLYHESSHALMALACGLDFISVSAGGSSGSLLMFPLKVSQLESESFQRRYLMATLAGAVGESIEFGEPALQSLTRGMGQEDYRKLGHLNKAINSLEDVVKAYSQADRYLRANWEAVERIADSLGKNIVLLQADVKAIAGDLPLLFEDKPVKQKVSKIKLVKVSAKTERPQRQLRFKQETQSLWRLNPWLSGDESHLVQAVNR